MQENLQNFNYEVFVSKTMLDMILRMDDPWDSSFYHVIILSESLSNRELKLLVPKLKKKNAVIFRKYLCEPINKEKGVLEELGIDQWIPREIGTDVLRDLISECTVPVIEEVKEKQHTETIEEIVMDLTKIKISAFRNCTKLKRQLSHEKNFVSIFGMMNRPDPIWHNFQY